MEWAAREALSWTDNILSGGGGGTPLISYIGIRLRVAPHFSSGIVEREKRERNASARENYPTREKATPRVAFSRVG